MTTYAYVTSCFDYADEFDVVGAFVTTQEWVDRMLSRAKDLFESRDGECVEFWFGTNEAVELESYEQFLNGVKIQECSKEFHDEFLKLSPWGVGKTVFNIL